MARDTKKEVTRTLLDNYGRTFSEELRIDISKGSPSPLFRLLCSSLLFSARIGYGIATEAARGLSKAGWTTAERLGDSTWSQRVKVLNAAGYTRYQERTATMLGEVAAGALEWYGGDLRKLREEAEVDPGRERALLKRFKGMGDVGVDIFFREVQVAWPEIAPFADGRALTAANRLHLGGDIKALTRLVRRNDFPRFVAALVRVEQENAYEDVLDRDRDAAPADGELEGKSKAELYDLASEEGIHGRSSMTKKQLVAALAGSRSARR
ncbi:MAG: Rho termination factor N-terminal domain-containing protein [Actinomycetota bacterium]